MKNLSRWLLLTAGTLAVVVSLLPTQHASAAFNSNNVMDDSIFNNSSSMSSTDIQNFLNQFPSSCLKNLVVPFPNNYFSYGGGVTAATAIRRVADLWDINPQVILATLEKESSVVTGNASYGCTYLNTAMGYNCPDSGACPANPADGGFSQQITKGGWLLKMAEERANGHVNYDPPLDPDDDRNYYYSGPMTQGYRQRRYDAPNQYYDGLLNIDGQTIHMDTGATASFYFYTPHFHGNQNLVSIFERWFGPTRGTVVIKGSGPTLYVLGSDPSVAYGVASGEVLTAYGLQNTPITGVSDSYLASLNTSSLLTTLFMKPGDGTIYLADHGHMSGIANGGLCTDWNLPCGQANLVSSLPYAVTGQLAVDHPLTDVMLRNNTLFIMNNGVRHALIGPNDFSASPYNGQSPTAIQSTLNSNQSDGTPAFYSSQFFRVGTGAIYYYNFPNSQYFSFSSFENFKDWYDGSPVSQDWFSSFNATPPSATPASDFVVDNGTYYLVAGSTAFVLPSQPPNVTSTNTTTYPGIKSLLQGKSTTTIDTATGLRISSGAIFTLQGGSLLPVPSPTDLGLLVSPQKIYNMPPSITTGYPIGKFNIPSGRIVKLTGSNAIYLYGSDKYLWGIPTISQVNANLRWLNNVLETAGSNVDSLGTKSYVSLVKIGSSYFAVEFDGAVRLLPASYLSTEKDNLAAPLSGAIANNLITDPKGIQFIHFDNGTTYALQNNTIRPISQFSTYASMGGNQANTLELPTSAVPAFNVGSPL